MKRNVTGETVAFQMISITDGEDIVTGTPTVYITKDNGTQFTGTGTSVHKGNGSWVYATAAGENDADHVVFTMKIADSVSHGINVYPTYPQSGDAFVGVNVTKVAGSAVSSVNDFKATGFSTLTEANVRTALGMNAADMDTQLDAILAEASWTGLDAEDLRLALGLTTNNLDTQLADIPTVAEFNARTLLAANYFDFTTDSVLVNAGSVQTAVGLASANLNTLLIDIPTVAEFNARTLLSADYFNAATDTVSLATDQAVNITKVAGVAVTGVNDFKATGFSTHSAADVLSAFGMATGNLDIQLGNILTEATWDGLSASDIREAMGLTNPNLDVQLAAVATNAQLEARTLPTASYFDPATDTVANVTNVANVTGNVAGSVNTVNGPVSLNPDTEVNVTKVAGVAVTGFSDFKADVSGLSTLDTTAVANSVWNASRASYTTDGSFGDVADWASGSEGGATPAQIWEYADRTVDVIKVAGSAVTGVNDFKANVSGLSTLDTTAVAQAVWNAFREDYTIAGTYGDTTAWASVSEGGGATPQQIWEYANRTVDVTKVGGSAVTGVNDFKADLTTLEGRLTLLRAGYLDNLNVAGTLANTANADTFKATGFSTFNPATDTVANVTTVGSITTKTGFSLIADYDAAKTAAQATTALSNAVWTNTKAGYIDAAITSRTLPTADYFNPATDTVANVTTVGTVTNNVTLAADQDVNVTKVAGSAVSGVNDFKANVSGLSTLSAQNVEDAVWNAERDSHTTAGTYGVTTEWSSEGGATPEQIWSYSNKTVDVTKVAGSNVTNISEFKADLTTLETRLSAPRAGYLDKLNVVGTLANTDNANTFKANVSGLSTFNPATTGVIVTTNNDKLGYTLHADYNAAKTAAQATTALSNTVWTNTKAGYIDAAITSRSSHTPANVRTEMDSNSTRLAAILNASVGTGPSSVNADTLDSTGTNMYYKTAGDVGIPGAFVRAYVKTEYDAGNFDTKHYTTTNDAGGWVKALGLYPGVTYTIEFIKSGFETKITTVTPS